MTFVEPSTAAPDDSISRSAAINVVKKYLRINKDLFDAIEYELGNLPSAQPEMIREIRKWINSSNRGNADYFIVEKIEEIINKYE